ncbi:hypothetical protein IWW52_003941, partial [Coemansia sp. RSA 2704]
SLVYKNRGSRVEGKVVVRTSDKLKVRQISIRLISTELVDFHDKSAGSGVVASGSGASGLHSYLQKSSKTMGTWMILAKGDSAHVLEAGKHSYSFEVPLPKGLDGSIESKVYTLEYKLETRLEYSFKFKPDLTLLTPLELVQVPMASNLQADDRISLRVIPGKPNVPAGMRLALSDVPRGRAWCLEPDVITQKESFVLHHLWDDVLSLRLRLPFGRVLPAEESPVLDVEAVPLARNHRCTAFKIALEEISIIARPQRAGLLGTRTPDAPVSGRRPSAALSHLSSSSEDSLPASSHNAWAYARECSSAYDNSITRVRELSSASARWPYEQFTTLGAYHGILAAKLNMNVPRAGKDGTHTDTRNSHIQVHHQLMYELEFRVVGSEMVDLLQKEPRVRAAAHIYNTLGSANIVRRDEITDERGPGVVLTVRGTLPVAVVSRKIAGMWGIRDVSTDPETEPSAVAAAIREAAATFPEPASPLSVPMPGHHHGRRPSAEAAGSHRHAHSAASTPQATAPPPAGFTGMPDAGGYPPMGFMAQPQPYPPVPTITEPAAQPQPYPPVPAVPEPVAQQPEAPAPEAQEPEPAAPQPASSVAYDPGMFQRQIEMFQEQQRKQQEQFFQQLTAQYAQMMLGQPQGQQAGPALPASLAAMLSPSAAILSPSAAMAGSSLAMFAPGAAVTPTASQQSNPQQVPDGSASDAYAVLEIPPGGRQASRTSTANSQLSDGASAHTAEDEPQLAPLIGSAPTTPAPADPGPEAAGTEAAGTGPAGAEPGPGARANGSSGSSLSAPSSGRNGRSSPPPSYEDLLPPEYEVPAHQPPPYGILDGRARSGRARERR